MLGYTLLTETAYGAAAAGNFRIGKRGIQIDWNFWNWGTWHHDSVLSGPSCAAAPLRSFLIGNLMDLLPGPGHNRRRSNFAWCRWHGSSWGCCPLLFSQSGSSFCFVRKWCYWRFTVIIDNGSHASSHCSMVDAAFVFGSLAGLPYFPMNFILILADLGFSIIIGIVFGFTDNFVQFIW